MIGTDQYDSVSKAVRITADRYVSEPAPEKRVGAVSEKRKKKKKKKKDTARTPESDESYRYQCPTCVGHWYFAKNGVSMQPRKKMRIYVSK